VDAGAAGQAAGGPISASLDLIKVYADGRPRAASTAHQLSIHAGTAAVRVYLQNNSG